MSTTSDTRRVQRRMSLTAHLIELRKRATRAGVAIILGCMGGWLLADLVISAMRESILILAREQNRLASLNYDNIAGAFELRMQIAITIGLVLASPVWLYQLWAFVVPALTRRELRYGLGFFCSAVPLFLLGAAAGWLVVPHIATVLAGFAAREDSSIIRAGTYFDFALKLVLAVGVAFVLPVFLVLLNFLGAITARAMLRSWRIAVVAITLFTAMATPAADVLAMFLLAVPMLVLYFAAVGVAFVHDRRERKRQAAFVLDDARGGQ